MISHISRILIGTALMLTSAQLAHAEVMKMRVMVDESQILQLPATPGAIIIGNPTVADVSIQGQKLFIHGRAFGQTNLTILDLQGNQVASFDLVTVAQRDDSVAVFKNERDGPNVGFRFTYSCIDTCNSVLTAGDDPKYFGQVEDQIKKKFELATGSQSAEAKAPEAPQ